MYQPRKVFILENGGYTELSYDEFCRRKETNSSYADKLFLPLYGMIMAEEIMILASSPKVEHIRGPRKVVRLFGERRNYGAKEPCRLRRGDHSGISSDDVATKEGASERSPEG